MKQIKLKGVYKKEGKKGIFTKNLVPGKIVYDENIVSFQGNEYREWNPQKSKLAAAIHKGINQMGIYEGKRVLYLGAASGTTVSHVSDIVGKKGFIFALDFAPRVVRDLIFVCEDRLNIAPLLADAHRPKKYAHRVSQVDVVYMDIAQRDQAEIFLSNVTMFLKKGGFGILALKARSVDVTKKPKLIFRNIRNMLEKHLTIVDYRELAPYEKDHAIFVCKLP